MPRARRLAEKFPLSENVEQDRPDACIESGLCFPLLENPEEAADQVGKDPQGSEDQENDEEICREVTGNER